MRIGREGTVYGTGLSTGPQCLCIRACGANTARILRLDHVERGFHGPSADGTAGPEKSRRVRSRAACGPKRRSFRGLHRRGDEMRYCSGG